ncbi:MAG: hypothetical protein ACKD6N_05410 [Candidatus Bathyarchaeota archaeon]
MQEHPNYISIVREDLEKEMNVEPSLYDGTSGEAVTEVFLVLE